MILPTGAVAAIAEPGSLKDSTQTVVALWRTPERIAAAKSWEGRSSLVDVASFDETALIAARRGGDGLPVPIPIGPVASTYRAPGAPVVIETSVMPAGTLALRGRMVPTHALQPHAGRPLPDHTGYVDTGFACNRGRNAKTLIVTALLCLRVATLRGPVVPVIARVRGDEDAAVPIALDGYLRACSLRRASVPCMPPSCAASICSHRTTANWQMFPVGDALDDATVPIAGRGRLYPTLSVAMGERVRIAGALSVEAAARHLNTRYIDGIVVGDGFSPRMVEAFLTVLAQDPRF